MARHAESNTAGIASEEHRKKQMVANLCRLLGDRAQRPAQTLPDGVFNELTPRVRQTLEYLLAGTTEKQIARKLGISPNTVHVYVKELYRKFDVCSRGELLARFVQK
ncbi:MAG TPA: LuxR family transcriptional regulator [Tepidisphaeraceae bacterium]|nr:LuxR family transcriptional regulator [Tepidisphaeraceae bacterium]